MSPSPGNLHAFLCNSHNSLNAEGEEMFPKKSVKQNEMCAASWPFYPKILHFLEITEQRFLLFSPLSSHDITAGPVTTMYIGIWCTNFIRPYFSLTWCRLRLVDEHNSEMCHSVTRRYTETPFFSHINLQTSPLYMRPSMNYFRMLANAQCHCNPCVVFRHTYICSTPVLFVLKHCLNYHVLLCHTVEVQSI